MSGFFSQEELFFDLQFLQHKTEEIPLDQRAFLFLVEGLFGDSDFYIALAITTEG
jgi:hypothetical protein